MLSPEERYALKMHGVCVQAQPGVFMIRIEPRGDRLRQCSQAGHHRRDLRRRLGPPHNPPAG